MRPGAADPEKLSIAGEEYSVCPTLKDIDLCTAAFGCEDAGYGGRLSLSFLTSCRRAGGSLELAPQMFVPNGYADAVLQAPTLGLMVPQFSFDVPGVFGCDPGPGLCALPVANDSLRVSWDWSARNEDFRIWFVLLCAIERKRECSTSSSEDANTSESGVDLRSPGFDRSSKVLPKFPKVGRPERELYIPV